MADQSKSSSQPGAQAKSKEGEKNEDYRQTHSGDPGLTPGSAEGEEDTVDKALNNQSKKEVK